MAGEARKRIVRICDNLAAVDEEVRRIKEKMAQLKEGKVKWNGRKVVLASNLDNWKIETLGSALRDTKKEK